MTERPLGARVLRGASWGYASFAAGRLLGLVATAILARLLEPSEFGLVALALLVTTLLDTVRDLGVTQALVVARDEEAGGRADAAFAFSFAAGLVLWGLTAILAWPASAFFDEPELRTMMPLLGATFVLRAGGLTHYALAQRALDFRARTTAEIAEVATRSAVGIGLALGGAGAYSLVWGYLAGAAAMTLTLWMLVRWRPHGRPRRADLRALLGFGGALTAIDLVAAFNANVDYLFVGSTLGTAALGLYTIAFRVPEVVVRSLAQIAGQVLYPAFATLEGDALGQGYLRALRYTLALSLPAAAALAILAEPLIVTVFGDEWRGAIEASRLIALFALAGTLGIPSGSAYKAKGRARVLLLLAVPRGIALLVALALFAEDGIAAVAACQALTALASSLAGTLLARRLLGVGGGAMLAAVAPVLAATVVMAAAVLPFAFLDGPAVLLLLGGSAVAVTTYVGALWLIDREVIRYVLRAGRRPPAAPAQAPAADRAG